MATHPRTFQPGPTAVAGTLTAAGGGNATADTTYTKIFVGGLAWETQRDTMRRYFEQFGEILEAVVITDKNTGRSKGYGFVTFKEPESATRACENPSPVIDGRRANCNLAFLGASNRTRPPTPQFGIPRFRPQASNSTMFASAYRGAAPVSTTYYHQPAHYALPYSVYGYPYSAGYSQETMYPMNYYGVGGQQHQFSYYSQATPGVFANYHPYYAQYSQSTHAHGGLSPHYPQMIQYPYLPQQFGSGSGAILSLPTSIAAPTAGVNVGPSVASSSSQPPRNTNQNKAST